MQHSAVQHACVAHLAPRCSMCVHSQHIAVRHACAAAHLTVGIREGFQHLQQVLPQMGLPRELQHAFGSAKVRGHRGQRVQRQQVEGRVQQQDENEAQHDNAHELDGFGGHCAPEERVLSLP